MYIKISAFLVLCCMTQISFGQIYTTPSGSVGIGTQTPSAKFVVVGSGGGSIDIKTNGRVWVGAEDGTNQAGVWMGTTGAFVGQCTSTGIGFWNGDAWRLSVYNTGKVAIGTLDVSGNHLLYVNGSILTTEVNVKLKTAWPDYVFGDTYKLPPLSELEHFIKLNKHLPGVPNADEVKENGVAIGEINAVLLKKIEEMTLYLIELKKENEAQDKEIAELKKQINK